MWNKRRKEWIINITHYRDISVEVARFCKSKGIFIDLIPAWLFDLFEYKIPFSDPSKRELVDYNYENDLIRKPRLNQLPELLYNALYDF